MTLRQTFDRADLNVLADASREIQLGQTLQQDVKQTYRKINPDTLGASPYALATLDVIALPDEAKASTLFRAYARAGTAGTGEMTVAARHATPATGQIAITPSGDIATLAADAITDLDFEYLGERGDVQEFEGTVTANVLTLPVQLTTPGVVMAMEIEALVGTATGAAIILAPGAGAPVAGQARLDIAKGTVTFAAADAVTSARVKLLRVAEAELSTLLAATTSIQ